MHRLLPLPVALLLASTAFAQSAPVATNALTLEKVMSDPDWIGAPVEQAWWAWDSQQVQYLIKRDGATIRDTYQQKLDGGIAAKIDGAARSELDAAQPVFDATRTRMAFVRNGDVFVRDLRSGGLTQATRSDVAESLPQWSRDGNLVFRVGNDWYQWRAGTGVSQAAIVKAEKDPNAAPKADDLRERQLRLIATLKNDKDKADAARAQDEQWRRADGTRAPAPTYLGADVAIVDSALSPDGRWLLVVTSAKDADAGQAGKMPKYVTESGYEEFEEVRTRVGHNAPVAHKLWLVDVANSKANELKFDTLPGIKEDPLAALRKAAKQDPLKGARAVRIETDGDGSGPAIHWSDDGRNAAVLVRAIDNKDRWLASVDLAATKLVSRHRLTDPGWINWNFNDFGWTADNALWFLSEQTGYSHLYLSDGGAPRALTSGKWEVSAPQLSADGKSFYFVCNREWPGDYEVCAVDRNGGAVREVTSLDGVEDFALSPDGSKVLARHSRSYTPAQISVVDVNGGGSTPRAPVETGARQLTDTRKDEFKAREWIQPEYVQVPSQHGAGTIWGKYYGPKNPEAGRKYPIVMFVHGAGYTQNVHERYPYYFREQMFHNLLVAERLHRARSRLPRLGRLRPRLAHGDLPADGPSRTRGLPRRPGLARGEQAGRQGPRRHLRRFLRRLHDVHGAVPRAGDVQGRRRTASGHRLVAVQPRVHRQHPQHARPGPAGLPEVLADRIRRQAAGPPADRPRHDRRQRVLQGFGDAGAAPDRTAQGQVGIGRVPPGTPQLRAPRRLVRRVPAHLRVVRAHAEVSSARPAPRQRCRGAYGAETVLVSISCQLLSGSKRVIVLACFSLSAPRSFSNNSPS